MSECALLPVRCGWLKTFFGRIVHKLLDKLSQEGASWQLGFEMQAPSREPKKRPRFQPENLWDSTSTAPSMGIDGSEGSGSPGSTEFEPLSKKPKTSDWEYEPDDMEYKGRVLFCVVCRIPSNVPNVLYACPHITNAQKKKKAGHEAVHTVA